MLIRFAGLLAASVDCDARRRLASCRCRRRAAVSDVVDDFIVRHDVNIRLFHVCSNDVGCFEQFSVSINVVTGAIIIVIIIIIIFFFFFFFIS